MDKGINPLSVDDVIRLTAALKEAGVPAFKGLGIEITFIAEKKATKRQKVTPEAATPKNAVDLALDNTGRAVEGDDAAEE